MNLEIPFETPSTRGPGNRGLVRDNLKELRQGKGDETRTVRALADYKVQTQSNTNIGGEWRLPWTATRQKTQLQDSDEPIMVAVTTCLLLSRLAQQSLDQKDHKRANAYLAQGYKALPVNQGSTTQSDLSKETIETLRSIFSGLAHELMVIKLLDSGTPIPRANAAVHARIAMYAQEMFSSASQRCPKPLKAWIQDHRDFVLAVCNLMVGYEQAALGQQGAAIAYFKLAKLHPKIMERATQASSEAESANRLVMFQPIPSSTPLPAGRCVVDFKEMANYF